MKKSLLILSVILIASNSYAQYCTVSATCDEYISNVQIGTINNSSSCGSDGYTDFTSLSTPIAWGESLYIAVTNGNTNYPEDQCGIWVDWNNNQDFTDDPAITVSGTPGVGPYTATITCPAGTLSGPKRLRVRILYTGAVNPCGQHAWGETEDYTLEVEEGYCNANSNNPGSFYIQSVKVGNQANNTTHNANGYSDYSAYIAMDISSGGYNQVAIAANEHSTYIPCKVWVDWNNNFDFTDDPAVNVIYDGLGYYTAQIICPPGTTPGIKRARIRIAYNQNLEPCRTNQYGETEDYTIHVTEASGYDLAAMSWDSPNSGSLTNEESIHVAFRNFGISDARNFTVNYQINNGNVVSETFPEVLPSYSEMDYEFQTKADLSTPATAYVIKVWPSLPGDFNTLNDTLTKTIYNTDPPHEMAALSLVAPASGALTSSENITVRYKNNTTRNETNVLVSYRVNNGPINTDTIESITSDSQIDYTFNNKADLSVWVTDYTIKAWVSVGNDVNHSNDSISSVISNTVPYCAIGLGGSSCPGDITQVSITGTSLNNTSHQCNDANFSTYYFYNPTENNTATLVPGNTYQLNVVTSNNDITSVWIDYNQDGNYDASEWTQISTAAYNASANITIPSGALTGKTGMRIRSRYAYNQNDANSACINFGSGVAEDYIITIIDPELTVSPATLFIAQGGGTMQLMVTANNLWTATSDQAWCTVTPSGTGSGTIEATCAANTSSINERTATITITCGSITQTVTVTQAKFVPQFTITPTSVAVSAAAGSTDFSFTTNTVMNPPLSLPSWLSYSVPSAGVLRVYFTGNTGAIPRSATVPLIYTLTGETAQTLTLTQLGTADTLIVTPAERNIAYTAGSTTLTVLSNLSWTTASNQTWCTVTPSGSGNGNINVTFTENTSSNARTASITVAGGSEPNRVITINQAGYAAVLSVSPDQQSVPTTTGEAYFGITSNIAWTASSDQSWCTVTTSGTGNGEIKATYEANTTINARSATITVSGSGVSSKTVTITQAGIQAKAPSVVTTPATGITYTTATLHGVVNANNLSSAITFEYGTTEAYGTSVNATPSVTTGLSYTEASLALTQLLSNTTYHFRVKAVNELGAVVGYDVSFVTKAYDTIPSQLKDAAIADLIIYPNPGKGLFNIEFKQANPETIAIKVLNNIGVVVFEKGGISTSNRGEVLNLEKLPNGVYTVILQGTKTNEKRSIIIQK